MPMSTSATLDVPAVDHDALVSNHLATAQLAARWSTTVGHLANLRCLGAGPAYLKINGGKVLYPLSCAIEYETNSLISPRGATA